MASDLLKPLGYPYDIKQKKANLKSLKDTWLDLSEDNPYSEFLMTVMGGVNQLERDLIRMRQREGIGLAKKEGKYRGRVKNIIRNMKALTMQWDFTEREI